MLKALLKKQFMEFASQLMGGKKNKKRSKGMIALLILLAVYIVGVFGFMFYAMMSFLCEPIVESGNGWLYFTLAALTATTLGIFGSVFATKSQLYDARDNELLMAMPIKPSTLLLARMLVLYIITAAMEFLVMIPAEIVYMQHYAGAASLAAFIPALLILPLLSLLSLTISCLLGWAVAVISSKMKHKSLVTVLLSLAFIGAYMYVTTQLQNVLGLLLANMDKVGTFSKVALFPLYQLGLACEGGFLPLLLFALIVCALFCAVCALLAGNFIKTSLASKPAEVSKEKLEFNASDVDGALLRKEFIRFFNSPIYILNCAIGTVMMVIAAVALIIKRDLLQTVLPQLGSLPSGLLAGAAVCLLASMNNISAPSISLEGRALWQLKALPVPAAKILRAKLSLHLIITLPSALIFAVIAITVMGVGPLMSVMIILASAAFTLVGALLGLCANLKLPHLDWTNETVAVKQSPAVMISMLFCWLLVFASVGIYLLAGSALGEVGVAALCILLYAAVSAGLFIYMKKNGEKLFTNL